MAPLDVHHDLLVNSYAGSRDDIDQLRHIRRS